jgi:hypothetical protein
MMRTILSKSDLELLSSALQANNLELSNFEPEFAINEKVSCSCCGASQKTVTNHFGLKKKPPQELVDQLHALQQQQKMEMEQREKQMDAIREKFPKGVRSQLMVLMRKQEKAKSSEISKQIQILWEKIPQDLLAQLDVLSQHKENSQVFAQIKALREQTTSPMVYVIRKEGVWKIYM